MSKTVDERVVSMQFDNKRFESNVQTTLGTLDKLKKSLKLDGATKGLSELDSAAKRVNTPMADLGSSVETVRAKFSALQIMAVTALSNITNTAFNAGKKIASALAIDPIRTGFSEYETQINAIQTILANTESKGSTLQDVNNALAELNAYADKTIYNFTEMTRNIGTFTAAGVDLDTSVSAIKGIANLAAVSGSTSQQASTAMYQLSQALASGTVKLMDWNSVVNAGMGGQVFQDSLKETARIHGINIDGMIKKEGSFRETLKDGWLTAEILTETLSKFTGDLSEAQLKALGYNDEQIKGIIKMGQTANDAATKVKTFTQLFDTLKEAAQSGWTKTWEIIVGDFGEAKDLLTEISDMVGGVIGDSAESRNDLLAGTLSTGWKQLLSEGINDAAGFEETVTEVAKKHGVDLSKMINDETTFQDTLKDGWLNVDILSESVKNFGTELKSMSKAELEAAGYTTKDVEAFEALEKKLQSGEISLEKFSKLISRPSGRELLIESLKNSIAVLGEVLKPVTDAFKEIFPTPTADRLYGMIQAFRDFTANLSVSDTTAGKLKRTFKGVFATFDIAIQVVKAIGSAFGKLLGYLAPTGSDLLSFTATLGDGLVAFSEWLETGEVFSKVFGGIATVIGKTTEGIRKFISGVVEIVKSIASIDTSGVETFSDKMKTRFEPLTKMLTGIAAVIKKVAPIFFAMASKIGEALHGMAEGIGNAIGNADYNGLFDLFNGGLLAGILIGVNKLINCFSGVAKDTKGFCEGIKDIKDAIVDTFGALQSQLKAEALRKIAVAIGILAASLLVISLIDSDKLTTSLMAVAALFGELMGSMKIFSKIADGKNFKDVNIMTAAMIKLSVALLILAAAMKILSTMSWKEMGVALISTAVGMGVLVGAVKILPTTDVKKSAKNIKRLASSLIVLAIAMKIMSSMSWKEMGVALISTAVGMGVLVGAVKILPTNKVKKSARAIKKMASALLVLAIAMKIMSSMSWKEMGVALISMGVGLGAMVGALRLLPKDSMLRSAGMMALATSIVILGAALKIMSSMSWKEMGIGLISLAASLGILVGTVRLLPKNMFSIGVGMLVVANSISILAKALVHMAGMSWEEMGKGLLALGVSLGILIGAMWAMKKAVAGAGAMILVAFALSILTPQLKKLGSMSLKEVGTALLVLAGAFVVLGAAAKFLAPMTPLIFKLSAALAVLGLAIALAGAGIFMLSMGLTGFAAAGAGVATAIVAIVSGIIGLIPYLAEQIGVALITLCGVIYDGLPAIGKAIKAIIITIVDTLIECVPVIVRGILVLVMQVLAHLVEFTPMIVDLLFKFFIALIDGIARNLPALIQSCVNLLMQLFQGVIDALKDVDMNVLIQGIEGVGLLSAIVIALSLVAGAFPLALVGVVGLGLVIAELGVVLSTLGTIFNNPAIIDTIANGGNLMMAVGTAIGQFIGGITGGLAQGVTASLPQIGTNLSNFMANIQPFIEGAKSFDASALDGVAALAGVILALTAANVLDGLTSWFTGGSSVTKFADELAPLGAGLKAFSDEIVGIDSEAVLAASKAAKNLAIMTATIPNEGGVASWFAGENSISKFATELPALGAGLLAFSIAAKGVDAEAVKSASEAGKALADMTSTIPNEGGVSSWFAGENSISKFAEDLLPLGIGLRMFSLAVSGMDCNGVAAAATAAKAITEMTSEIPNEGGVSSWFAGENSVSKFSADLLMLGIGLNGFSKATEGIKPETVVAAATAGKALADMASAIPNEGGVASWFAGENSLAAFSNQLPSFGTNLALFATNLGTFSEAQVATIDSAIKALTVLTEVGSKDMDVVKITRFGNALSALAPSITSFVTGITKIGVGAINSATLYLDILIDSISSIASGSVDSLNSLGDALSKLGSGGVTDFINSFTSEEATSGLVAAAETMVTTFIEGVKNKIEKVKESFEEVASEGIAATTTKSVKDDAKQAGKDLVSGFAKGIDEQTFEAEAKAAAMASAALTAAKEALDENSPSKEMYKVGKFAGIGFVNAFGDYESKASKAGSGLANASITGMSNVISRISESINSDIDSQPTIRPVLDLSDVESGANTISGLLAGRRTLAVDASSVGAVSASMAARQNGNYDLASAINKLAKSKDKSGDTYNFNGFSYSEGSDVANAIQTLVRAAKMEGRT